MKSPLLLVVLLALAGRLTAADAPVTSTPAPAPAAPSTPGQSYALLIGGLAGEEPYSRWYADWVTRFQTYLTKTANVPPANVTTLLGDAATAKAINGAFGDFARRAGPQDQFILFIVGHGEISGQMPALTLRGPDLTAAQLAAALSSIQAKNQVILDFCASSGNFLKRLVSPDRVNITATSPAELEEPVFAEFFLRGLESKRAGAGKAGPITLLDAYNWAAHETLLWIARWEQTGSDTWKAEGRETVEIFQKLYAGVAARKLDPASDAKIEDAPVEFKPAGEVTDDWLKRRVIDEHAVLEDCGQEIGVSVSGEKGYQPILGQKPQDPGYLAAHTVLGQAAISNP